MGKEKFNGEKNEELGSSRLSVEEVKELLEKYGPQGLGEDGEYFVIETKDGKIFFHKWKAIPQGGVHTNPINIEKHIQKRLESNKSETAPNEEQENKKKVA